MTQLRALAMATVVFSLFTGCNAPSGPSQITPRAPGATRLAAAQTKDVLYVANSETAPTQSVTVYGDRPKKLLRSITDGISYPFSLAIDGSGHLYVANYRNVTEYGDEGRTLVQTISRNLHSPFQLTFDSTGNLYVLDATHINMYVNGKSRIMHTIKVRGYTIATDASNNLYVGTLTTVNVYPPGSKTPSLTISDGILHPDSLVIDSVGNLYVANGAGGTNNCGDVTVYAAGSVSALYTIVPPKDSCNPLRLALDGTGNLYVASGEDTFPGTVQVYAPGSNTPLRTIADGINGPESLGFDKSGNLYVANYNNSTVTAYAPESTSPLQTISDGITHPVALAIEY